MVGARRKRSSGPWTLPCTCCGPEPSNPAVNQSGLTSPCQRIQAGQRHHSRTGRAPIYTSTLAKPHHLLPIFPPATVNCVPLSAPIVLYSHCLSATCLVCLSTPPAISISINRSFSCHTAAFTGASRISSPVQHSLSPRHHFLENACRLRPAATGTAGSPRRTRSCCRLRARRRGTTEQSIRLDAHGPGKCTTRAPQKTGQRMRKQLLRLRSPRRSGPLLPSNGSLLRRPGRSRSMLSSGRCMYRSSRRPNSQPHRNYVSAICDRQHNHGRALRAADERRKPRKHGTEPILPFPVHTDDLSKRSCLLVRLYKLPKRCCKLYKCSCQWRPGRNRFRSQWRRYHYCDSKRRSFVCTEHLLKLE